MDPTPDLITQLLDQFRTQNAPGPFDYPYCHHHQGNGQHGFHLVIGCLTHGNENGTLPAALRLLEGLNQGRYQTGGPITLLLGNTDAARANRRFLEEDFNRVFTFDRHAESLERRLAETVRPILDSADFFLDLHQTQTPTLKPFWTFAWDGEHAQWARALNAAPVGLTRPKGQQFSTGTCCLDEYVRRRGRVGLTVEIGYRGLDQQQAEHALRIMQRAMQVVNLIASGKQPLEEVARASSAIEWYHTAHVVAPASPQHRLRPGLINWLEVDVGETLSAPGSPPILSPARGHVLFPKYPSPTDAPPPELFRLATPVADPEALTPA